MRAHTHDSNLCKPLLTLPENCGNVGKLAKVNAHTQALRAGQVQEHRHLKPAHTIRVISAKPSQSVRRWRRGEHIDVRIEPALAYMIDPS